MALLTDRYALRKIPRGYTVCEHTVNLPVTTESDSEGAKACSLVINDLSQDTRFCDRPFVLDGPKARFYAGVPITMNGVNIGAYCVLDDKVRDGLKPGGTAFLRDMSITIKRHLEMVRAKAEHERGALMVQGIGTFVAGACDFRNLTRITNTVGRGRRSLDPKRAKPTEVIGTNKRSTASAKGQESTSTLPSNVFVGTEPVPKAIPDVARVDTLSKPAEDLREEIVTSNVRCTFKRAAQLIRQSVGIDGAVFLDASIGSYGGLVGDAPQRGGDGSNSDINGVDAPNALEDIHISHERPDKKSMNQKRCPVLGLSLSSIDEEEKEVDKKDVGSLHVDERFLRRLLKRYPQGKVWNFGEIEDASSDDQSSESNVVRQNETHTPSVGGRRPSAVPGRRLRSSVHDRTEIQRLFPGVRSLALVGIWDSVKGRWFAACAVWTRSPFRTLSDDFTVNFIAAFCDVTMAEIHRIEAQNASKSKTDFISTISHELRSPLHGILASAECLQEQPGDAYSTGLVSQIEVCGRTLLDIVDHLLDFSKINHFSRNTVDGIDVQQSRKRAFSKASRTSQLGVTMSLDADVLLDAVTEEVVETAVYSYCASKDQQIILDRKVIVVLDIDRSRETDWRCRIAT